MNKTHSIMLSPHVFGTCGFMPYSPADVQIPDTIKRDNFVEIDKYLISLQCGKQARYAIYSKFAEMQGEVCAEHSWHVRTCSECAYWFRQISTLTLEEVG